METLTENFIVTRAARLGYRGKTLPLAPLDISLPSHAVATLIGPNGSGKSTLLKAIVGERYLISGDITVGGKSCGLLQPKDLASLVAFIPQELTFPGHLTVRNTLRSAFLSRTGWFGSLTEREEAEAEKSLRTFGLSDIADKSLERISAGERQRVFLGRGFLQPAKILIWDEPTNHLDPMGTELFSQALLDAQAERKKSILLATHDERLVEKVASWIVALTKAGLFYSGPPDSSGPAELFNKIFGLTRARKPE